VQLRLPVATRIAAVRPSAALAAKYDAKLQRAVDDMHKSLMYWLRAAYRTTGADMALDASPARLLRSAMRKLARRWQSNFDDLAPKLAEYFATAANERVAGDMKRILREHGFTVRFTMTRKQNEILQAVIGQQVALIKSIASQHLAAVEGIVMRSVQKGRAMGQLARELEEQVGVTKRRAAVIAKTQTNMSTAVLERTNQLELGLTHAKWGHSAGGRVPRPEHVAFSGKAYEIAKGAFLEGVWTWPGMEINCRCVSYPIIPGFDY
jgi:SPP1 gp7 family putative phage head morphogenesis protein